jgi:hypothetical protein
MMVVMVMVTVKGSRKALSWSSDGGDGDGERIKASICLKL